MTAAATAIVRPLDAPLDVVVTVPGSKSFTNRALLVAALADGTSVLRGALFSDDTEAMVGCLRSVGIDVELDRAVRTITVHGRGGHLSGPASLDVRRSGATARFIVPALMLGTGRFDVDGHPQMRARPMRELDELLEAHDVAHVTAHGALPFRIDAAGPPSGGRRQVRGDESSQFLSGLLMAAPYFRGGCTIEVTTPLISVPYVAMTLATMSSFGVEVSHSDDYREFVVPEARYQATDYPIEPDASAASYFFGAAAICGGRLTVSGLGSDALQGDLRFLGDLERLGATIVQTPTSTTVRSSGRVGGGLFDLRHHSDTAPTLAAVAAFAETPLEVTGIGFIRRKESNRIAVAVTELRRCGVDAVETDDGFRVLGGRPGPARFETYDDHRNAMAFALIGLRVDGIEIADPGCVAKTFPDYFDVLEGLRNGTRHE